MCPHFYMSVLGEEKKMGVKLFEIGIRNGDIADHRLTEKQLNGFKQAVKACNILLKGKKTRLESVDKLLSHILQTRRANTDNPESLPYAIILLQDTTIVRLEYYKQGKLIHDLRCPDLQNMNLKTYNEFNAMLEYYTYLKSFGIFQAGVEDGMATINDPALTSSLTEFYNEMKSKGLLKARVLKS